MGRPKTTAGATKTSKGTKTSAGKVATPPAKPPPKSTLDLPQRLVLQRWLLARLGVDSFDTLRDALGGAGLEGMTPDGSMLRFTQSLLACPRKPGSLSNDQILRFDERIQAATNSISRQRGLVVWKYFQYVALLFTEIYLDAYFGDRAGLCDALNLVVEAHNVGSFDRPYADALPRYTSNDLGRLAFWSATGSGKTLILHANLRQYERALRDHNLLATHNRVLLLTPKDLLTTQHLTELRKSGFVADRFVRSKSELSLLRDPFRVYVLEVTKLADRDGKDTVDIKGFGDNNLVLIDEGHQGLGSEVGTWKTRRDQLSARGFAFEYSATFGQAVQSAKGDEMAREYARCIALDYSYREFYRDGFGKEYTVLNLKEDPTEQLRQRYIVGCLLAFYQQLRTYEEDGALLAGFALSRPLWVFVGESVSEVRKESGRDVSDVVDIVLALHRFVHRPDESRGHLEKIIHGASSLLDPDGTDVFAGMFADLLHSTTVAELYSDVLRRVFRTEAPGAVHLVERRGAEGEITLQVGAGPVFGLVKVGEPAKVRKVFEHEKSKVGLVIDPTLAATPLFDKLGDKQDRTHILIGSRKFTEGWNSWRVSTLGLMNLGRGEGAQIIQLFGRGVRLWGWQGCLKRSTRLSPQDDAPSPLPTGLRVLETLRVFGLRADYMKTFEEMLAREKVPVPKTSKTYAGVEIPVSVNIPTSPTLYTMDTPTGVDDRAHWPRYTLGLPEAVNGTDYLLSHPVNLDWYPRVDSARSEGVAASGDVLTRNLGALGPAHITLLDHDRLRRVLEAHCHAQGWVNLTITAEGIRALLASPGLWYRLHIPEELLTFTSMARVPLWQELAERLLKAYCQKYYARAMDVWSQPMMRYAPVVHTDENFRLATLPNTAPKGPTTGWVVELTPGYAESEQWHKLWAEKLSDPTSGVSAYPAVEPPIARVMRFSQHLYTPLLFANPKGSQSFKVHPVPMNLGEMRFVVDLEAYYKRKPSRLAGCELWLLRNQVRSGVRFFEAQNFYPDFLLWVVKGTRQHLAFVDPKGIRNLKGLDDPKIALAHTIKERQAKMSAPSDGTEMVLESFIVANTLADDVAWWKSEGGTVPSLDTFASEHHVVFQNDERPEQRYIDRILELLLAGS